MNENYASVLSSMQLPVCWKQNDPHLHPRRTTGNAVRSYANLVCGNRTHPNHKSLHALPIFGVFLLLLKGEYP